MVRSGPRLPRLLVVGAKVPTRRDILTLATGAALLAASPAMAQKKYDEGVSDTEIKIGHTMPYSGPGSAFAPLGKVLKGYIDMVNDRGGVNGRKINLISLDDAYSPPKAVEQTRKLVESDGVFAIMGSLGSPSQMAVAKYLNNNKVPQILLMVGAAKLNDHITYPWSSTFYSNPIIETQIYAQYLLTNKPNAKIAVLYQNDDYGKDYLIHLKKALGDKASMIIAEASYNSTDPTVDSQILSLKASGADVFFMGASPKFAAQAIRKAYELDWKADRIVVTAAAQIPTVLIPAGVEASKGVMTSNWIKLAEEPMWDNDPAMKDFYAFMAKWVPDVKTTDGSATYVYSVGQMMEEVLRRCGDDLTRENLMKQATNFKDFQLPMFFPGVKINISPENRIAWRQGQLTKFDGAHWQFVGDVVTVPEKALQH